MQARRLLEFSKHGRKIRGEWRVLKLNRSRNTLQRLACSTFRGHAMKHVVMAVAALLVAEHVVAQTTPGGPGTGTRHRPQPVAGRPPRARTSTCRSRRPRPEIPPPPPVPDTRGHPARPSAAGDLRARRSSPRTTTIFYVLDIFLLHGLGHQSYTALDGSRRTGCRLDRAKVELSRSIMGLSRNFKFQHRLLRLRSSSGSAT